MTMRSGVGSGVVEDVPVLLNKRLSSSLETDSPNSLSTPLSVVCFVQRRTSLVARNIRKEGEESGQSKVSTDYL